MNNQFQSEYERLKAIEAEYRMTIRVVAVLAERLLLNPDAELTISDRAMIDCPELIAWRDPANETTHIKIKR